MVDADVEIGGTDQRFNILAGRDLQKKMGKPQQDVMLLGPILCGTDGVQKMSKSLGNYIGIIDEPADMFGKVMSIPDETMWDYYTLVTDVPNKEIAALREKCEKGQMNPRDAKANLASIIVTEFHSDKDAEEAQQRFETIFKQGGKPEDMPELEVDSDEIGLIDALINAELVQSKSEARRVIEQGGVKINDEAVKDIEAVITVGKDGTIIQKGKRHFLKVVKR